MKCYLVVTPAFHKMVFNIDSFLLICFNETKADINHPTPERGTDWEVTWEWADVTRIPNSLHSPVK